MSPTGDTEVDPVSGLQSSSAEVALIAGERLPAGLHWWEIQRLFVSTGRALVRSGVYLIGREVHSIQGLSTLYVHALD
jgi:hypothetical protein